MTGNWDDLERIELLLIHLYTTETGRNGLNYSAVNESLRESLMGRTVEEARLISAFESVVNDGLRAAPTYPGTDVTRGLSLEGETLEDFLAEHSVGSVVHKFGFTSTTCGHPFPGNVQLAIRHKSGVDIARLSAFPEEKEVLIPTGADFLVLDRDPVTDPDSPVDEIVYMAEVDEEDFARWRAGRASWFDDPPPREPTPEQSAFVARMRRFFEHAPCIAPDAAAAGILTDKMGKEELANLAPFQRMKAKKIRIAAANEAWDAVGEAILQSEGGTVAAARRAADAVAANLKTIRLAAAGHLCVDLRYQGTSRRIEPYSLGRTRNGKTVLHAVRASDGKERSYRVDRIESAEATAQAFVPRHPVDLPPPGTGGVPAAGPGDPS